MQHASMAGNMDEFSLALQRLSSLHDAQIKALRERLEEGERARRQLEEKCEALKKANEDARRGVEQAKKKVRQQAKQIRELEEKLQNNGLEQHTLAAERSDCPSQAVAANTHRLNQTCATLFESPAPMDGSKVTVSKETPVRAMSKLSRQMREEEPSQEASGEEEREEGEGDTMDYLRGESIKTVADDVIIVDDDVTGNNHPAPPACLSSKSAIAPPALSNRERAKQNVFTTSDDLQGGTLPPSGPIHMVYSHARVYSSDVQPFGKENEQQSPKKPHTTARPLSLRDAGTSKVKWREVSPSDPASTSAATRTNLSDTKASFPERAGSPGDDGGESEGRSASSSPEQSSPSLLGGSSSPRKPHQSNSSSSSRRQQQHGASSTSTPVNMTHSLFARTPATGHVAVTTPVSMLKSAIPPSDSQFSLDMSQSAPLSPELCPLTTPTQKPHPPPEAVPAGSTIIKPPSKDALAMNVNCGVVPITPGVPSVNKILKDRRRWMKIDGQSPVPEKTAAPASYNDQPSVRKEVRVGGKRGQEEVNFEDEDEHVLPQSKVNRLNDTVASHAVDDDQTRLEYEHVVDSSSSEEEEEGEGGDSPMSPVLIYPKSSAPSRSSDATSVSASQAWGITTNDESYRSAPHKSGHYTRQRILEKAGLPTEYKFEAPIRKRADRDKLDGKACPDCQGWFAKDDGIHGNIEDHLRCTCRHKQLYHPPDEDSRIWNMSFPSTEECNSIMNRR